MDELTFTVHMPPVAWHRPQLNTRSRRIDGRGVRAYKHGDDLRYQERVRVGAIAALARWRLGSKGPWDALGEWLVIAEFFVADKRRRDIDNLCKNALDGLTGTVFSDDTQVVQVNMCKRYDKENPRTILTVQRVRGYMQ